MKNLVALVAWPFVLILAGCPTVPQSAPSVSAFREVGSVVEHTASGMQFPASQGEFRRSTFRQYDPAGRDVSAGYDFASSSLPISITVYVYPSPVVRSFGSPQKVVAEAKNTLARSEFLRVMNEIKQAHQDARAIGEEEVSAPASEGPKPGYLGHVSFTASFAGLVRPVESLAIVFCYVADQWTVKYRITYPAGTDARPVIDQFVRNLKWTIGRPNKAPEPTITSVTIRADARLAPAVLVAHL